MLLKIGNAATKRALVQFTYAKDSACLQKADKAGWKFTNSEQNEEFLVRNW